MIQSLIQTSMAQIGINGKCASFIGFGVIAGLIIKPIVKKIIELSKRLFNKIKKSYDDQKFTVRIKSLFCDRCALKHENHENLNLLKGEKVTTVTKETIFIPKNDNSVKVPFVSPSSPTQPRDFGDSPPPKYVANETVQSN